MIGLDTFLLSSCQTLVKLKLSVRLLPDYRALVDQVQNICSFLEYIKGKRNEQHCITQRNSLLS